MSVIIRRVIPMAMLRHGKQAYKNIAMDAASGRREAYGPFLRMMADAHRILHGPGARPHPSVLAPD